ncbi:uncharacterized protein [Haliotis asinina]|uniref:uncharacterized protein n=1 Tax=Haliotis asinina TaxID=109174 RepID=UPI0035321499
MKTSNVEIVSNTHARTDYNTAASVEYHYIDNVQDSVYQQATEENQPEAENDYEFIAETNPGYDYIEPVNDPRTFSRRGIVCLVPIFAGVVVNTMAGFFFGAFLLPIPTVVQMVSSRETSTIFMVVNAVAAASSGPLMIRYGFRKVAFFGSVLLIFSCISSSLATIDDLKPFITLSVMKGFSVGLLRSTGVVATVDHLKTRPAVAVIISYNSFITGEFSSLFTLIRSGIGLEIPALLGLVAVLFLQKNSHTHQNVTMLFKHPPFYALVLLAAVCSMVLSQVMLPVALVSSTERSSLKLALPLLCCSSVIVILDKILWETSSVSGAMYFGGVSLIVAGIGAIIAWVLLVRRGSRPSHVPAEHINHEEGDHTGDGERDDHAVGQTEDHVEGQTEDHFQDHVESQVEIQVEDHVEDHVEGQVEDHVEDHVKIQVEGQVEDHLEDNVEIQVEDHVQDHVEGQVEDHVEDHVEGQVEDHVEDHVEGQVEDHVEDQVEVQVEDHVEDHVESQVEDHVEGQVQDHVDNHVVVEAEDTWN